MANIKELGDGGPDGTRLGKASTNLVGFYGGTPIVQPSGAAQAEVAASVLSLTGTYNSTIIITAVTAVLDEVNALRTALVNLGLIAGA
tara:strand:+ start:3265 stop:3528 length:264 start_codon:yes stop_codon:yes gene_type:complete